MAQSKACQNRHVDLRSHQRTPRECPALFHAADDEWQRCRQDDVEPGVQTLRAHRSRGAGEDRWHVANAVVSRDDHRPECSHDTTKSIAVSVCPNQSSASGTQQTLGSVCKPSASTPSVSSQNLYRAVSNPSGKPAAMPII